MKNKPIKTKFFDDVSQKVLKTEKFATNFKFYIFAGVLLFLLATVVYSFFGFNLSNELKTQHVITVDYKNSVTDNEFIDIEKEITTIINNNGKFTINFERSGYVLNHKLTVKLLNDNNYNKEDLDTIFSQIKLDIEERWLPEIVNLEVSDATTYTPYFYQEVISALIATVLILAVLFVFMWIRHQLITATSMLIASVYNIGVLFSLLLLLRIPLTLGFLSYFVLSVFVSILTYVIFTDGIRKLELTEQKITNSKAAHTVVTSILPTMLLLFTLLLVLAVPMIIYFLIIGWSGAYTLISLLLSVIFGAFVGLVFTPACWATFYNRENDKRLKSKIEKQSNNESKSKKTTKKTKATDDEDKVVV